jgi:hypothetical protein
VCESILTRRTLLNARWFKTTHAPRTVTSRCAGDDARRASIPLPSCSVRRPEAHARGTVEPPRRGPRGTRPKREAARRTWPDLLRSQRAAKPRYERRSGRTYVVLDGNDLPVPQLENVRPGVPRAFSIGPRERDDGAAPSANDRVEPSIVISALQTPVDCRLENLTGLGRAVSGRRRLPEPRDSAASTPLHGRVD